MYYLSKEKCRIKRSNSSALKLSQKIDQNYEKISLVIYLDIYIQGFSVVIKLFIERCFKRYRIIRQNKILLNFLRRLKTILLSVDSIEQFMGMHSQSWDHNRCLMPFYVYRTSLKRLMIDGQTHLRPLAAWGELNFPNCQSDVIFSIWFGLTLFQDIGFQFIIYSTWFSSVTGSRLINKISIKNTFSKGRRAAYISK